MNKIQLFQQFYDIVNFALNNENEMGSCLLFMFWLMIHNLGVSRSYLGGEVKKNKRTFFSLFVLVQFRLSKTFWTMVTKVLLR